MNSTCRSIMRYLFALIALSGCSGTDSSPLDRSSLSGNDSGDVEASIPEDAGPHSTDAKRDAGRSLPVDAGTCTAPCDLALNECIVQVGNSCAAQCNDAGPGDYGWGCANAGGLGLQCACACLARPQNGCIANWYSCVGEC